MQQKSALCMSTNCAAKLKLKGTFGKRLLGAGAAEAVEAVVGIHRRHRHHHRRRRRRRRHRRQQS